MGRAYGVYGVEERHIQGFSGESWKAEGKRPLGRPRHRWEDNIKWDVGLWTGLRCLGIGTGGGHL